jgi:hypothetical protein
VISAEKDKQAITLLTDELEEFKDKGSLSFVEQLFKEKLIDESIVTLDKCTMNMKENRIIFLMKT